MARTVDVLVSFFVAQGNRALAKREPVPFARLRRLFSTDAAFDRGIRFWLGGADRGATHTDWFAGRRAQRFFALDLSRLIAPKPAVIGGKEVPRRMLAGFAGASGLLFVLRRDGGDDVYQVTNTFSARTTLTGRDLIDFVDKSPERDALREHWLWWNEHNLHWSTRDWSAFARAAAHGDADRLVQDASIVFSNAAFSEGVRRAWWDFTRAHRNPDFGPIFDFRYVETRDDLPLFSDASAAFAGLATALDAIAAFAEAQKLDGWDGFFRTARAALDQPSGDELVRDLFGDADLSPRSLRLLDAAWKSDAFGGMGSWNDLMPDDADGYQRVSQALFEAIPPALEAALNG
jgi:hypothetical protein